MLDHPDNHARAEIVERLNYFPIRQGLSVRVERKEKEAWIRSNPQDIIFINALGWRNAIVPDNKQKNTVYMVEHCELESSNLSMPKLRRFLQWYLEWLSVWRYQVAVPASHFLYSLFRYRSFFIGDRQKVLRLPYASNQKKIKRSKPGVSYAKKKIFHVGTINISYGIDTLLLGLAELKKRRSDWEVTFAGHGRHYDRMVALSNNLGLAQQVHFVGFIDEIELLREMDSTDVFLSHLSNTIQDWARCPSKLYLYLPYDRPIVTSMMGDNAQLLGSSGFYYKNESAEEIANALDRALSVADDWSSGIDPEMHTWKARAVEMMDWLKFNYPQQFINN